MLKLIADNLAIDRGGRRVIAGLSFALEQGKILIITGPNGIGKSTLLRTIAGLIPPAEGHLDLEDGEPERTPAEHMHYFGHQSAVKPALSVLENLAFWASFSSPAHCGAYAPRLRTPLEALDELGIGHTAQLPSAYLSAGQTRRLALARLLVTSRPIWLMDEPSSALDKNSEAQLLGLIEEHLECGGMALAATHLKLPVSASQPLHLETETQCPEDPSANQAEEAFL